MIWFRKRSQITATAADLNAMAYGLWPGPIGPGFCVSHQ